jgi:hypothetical protein
VASRYPFVPMAAAVAAPPPPPYSSRVPFGAFRQSTLPLAMSMDHARAFHDQYAAPPLRKYRPGGDARDAWINDLHPVTESNRVATAEDLYWQARLQKPEFRGKCKAAVLSTSERGTAVVKTIPLVPQAAKTIETSHLPPLPRMQTRLDPKETARCRRIADDLTAEMLQRR